MGKRVVYGLGSKRKMILLTLMFTLVWLGVDGKKKSQRKIMEVQRRLRMLNKPAVKTIKSEDGDIIDCVDIYKQPAFDHPALKNHTIKMKPSGQGPVTTEKTRTKSNESEITVISQLWHKRGRCPIGTVPIRRIRKRDLLRADSLESYGRKPPYITDEKANITKDSTTNGLTYFPQANRSLTVAVTQGFSYIGAKADINVWNPYVESNDDFSSAQIWLRQGPPEHYESVEAGWVVNPKVYGDTQTRLFAYWTADSSTTTGCFDLTCSGFVQTSPEIALGSAIVPVSHEFTTQYKIIIYLYKDDDGNWWLQYGDTVNIGYWPGNLFPLLSHNALYVMWGGEVHSTKVRTTPHTSTHMGSGNYAENLYGSACFIRQIRIMDYSRELKFPQWISSVAQEEYCYHADIYRQGYIGEPEFYFGGPGQNALCP